MANSLDHLWMNSDQRIVTYNIAFLWYSAELYWTDNILYHRYYFRVIVLSFCSTSVLFSISVFLGLYMFLSLISVLSIWSTIFLHLSVWSSTCLCPKLHNLQISVHISSGNNKITLFCFCNYNITTTSGNFPLLFPSGFCMNLDFHATYLFCLTPWYWNCWLSHL